MKIRSFEGLTGTPLENWLKELFLSKLQFKYFPSPGQIELTKLNPKASKGHHLEIDGILLINKIAVLVEITDQADKFSDKIKKFNRNCNSFISSKLSIREKAKLFNVPEDDLDDFEDIKKFKYLYIGTNHRFENSRLTRSDFNDYPNIQKGLYIFKPTHLEYLRQLTNLINIHARKDFYSALEFSPRDLDDKVTSLHLDFIKAEGKYITTDKIIRADIYLVKFFVKDLLDIARVSRYEGIPFILDQDGKESYQRFLIEQKLENISSSFILNDYKKSFPNTITLVLSDNCKEEKIDKKKRLTIPKNYSTLDIIDGQHRLYAYTNTNNQDVVREKSELLATAIKFKTEDKTQITKYSAKIFCEINANQAKVKNNLIYLIKYDVLGELDETAMAGKILLEINKGNSSLSDLFFTNSLRKRNKFDLPAIPVTTIIDNDLVPFLKGLRSKKQSVSNKIYEEVFGNSRSYFYNNKQNELVRAARIVLEQYFDKVIKIFKYDWADNASSYLISAKYIAAFIRFLRHKVFVEEIKLNQMENELKKLKSEIDIITKPNKSASFPKGLNIIPSTKHGINTIFSFLLDTNSFSVNNK